MAKKKRIPVPPTQNWSIVIGVRLEGMEPFLAGGFYNKQEIEHVVVMEYEGVAGCSAILIFDDGKSLAFKHKGPYTIIEGEWPTLKTF